MNLLPGGESYHIQEQHKVEGLGGDQVMFKCFFIDVKASLVMLEFGGSHVKVRKMIRNFVGFVGVV